MKKKVKLTFQFIVMIAEYKKLLAVNSTFKLGFV